MTSNKEPAAGEIKEAEDKILCIDKPAGITSFYVVKTVRRYMKIKKVGHAGTLDPFATGLLIVCTGKATKKTSQFMNMPKEYEAVLFLGKSTTTYDIAGEVVERRPVPSLTLPALLDYCEAFKGTIYQVPPMYSALKHKGVPLYKLARKGKDVSREARPVTIYDIQVLWFRSPRLGILIKCGKGTYIRSIAHDLGTAIGCGAFVESLRRTKIGDYSVRDAVPLEQFQLSVEHTL